MSEPEKIPYPDRLKAKLSEPNLMDGICSHIADGGSILDLVKMWDLRYSDVHRWIVADTSENGRSRQLTQAMIARDEWMKERILHEFKQISFADFREAFDEDGALLPIKEIPEHIARAISSIDVDELFDGSGENRERIGETKKIKFWNKSDALAQLGKELGLFVQRHHLSVDTKLEDLLSMSRKEKEPDASPAPPAGDIPV